MSGEKQTKNFLRDLIGDVDFNSVFEHGYNKEQGINLWVREGYADKYRLLQKASKKKFAKLLGQIVQHAIDRGIETLDLRDLSDPKAS